MRELTKSTEGHIKLRGFHTEVENLVISLVHCLSRRGKRIHTLLTIAVAAWKIHLARVTTQVAALEILQAAPEKQQQRGAVESFEAMGRVSPGTPATVFVVAADTPHI